MQIMELSEKDVRSIPVSISVSASVDPISSVGKSLEGPQGIAKVGRFTIRRVESSKPEARALKRSIPMMIASTSEEPKPPVAALTSSTSTSESDEGGKEKDAEIQIIGRFTIVDCTGKQEYDLGIIF
jgi:hypothetical protein